jgi:hypothetical protein
MADNMGLITGIVGQMSGRDTTNIDPKLLAIMAMRRKQKGLDNEPKVNVEDDIKAANAGKKMQPIADSTIKMAHDQWLAHLDKLGLEVVPKKQ